MLSTPSVRLDLPDPLPVTLTVEEAARVLRIGRNSAYEAIARGDLPSVRIGGRVLIPSARLLALFGVEVHK